MANEWRARMPKGTPQEGEAVIVFAAMNSKGSRVEFSGVVTHDCAGKMLVLAIEKPLKLDLTPNTEIEGEAK